MSDPKSEKLVDIPKNDEEKSLYDERLNTNQPIRPDWTDIKSKYTMPIDEKRLLVFICPILKISGANLEEIPRSNDDLSKETEKPFGPVKDKLLRPTVVEKLFLKDIDCGVNPKNYYELQEKTKTLDVRTEHFEFGIQQSGKISNFAIGKSADSEKFSGGLNIFSNKPHSLLFFDSFIQNFGKETVNFVHLTPFDKFVPLKINFSAYEVDGTIGTPKRLVDRPSKPKLEFYLNDFVFQLHYGYESRQGKPKFIKYSSQLSSNSDMKPDQIMKPKLGTDSNN